MCAHRGKKEFIKKWQNVNNWSFGKYGSSLYSFFFIFSVSLNCFQNEVIKNKNALGKKDNFTTKMF